MMTLCFYPELNVRKIAFAIFFKISKIYVAMQSGCYGDFAPILECRTHNFKFGLTRELSMMINIHLT